MELPAAAPDALPWPAWLWIALTIGAAAAQVLRNTAQRSLADTVGTVGATHVRFLFGLPFGLLGVALLALLGRELPTPNGAWLAWSAAGAAAQMAATGLMIAAMRERSFVVATAYVKTEPVLTALAAALILGEGLTLGPAIAVVTATAGVVLMSWPRAGSGFRLRGAALGIAAGAGFGISSVCFRGGVLALEAQDYVAAGVTTVALALALQTAALSGWLLWRRPQVMRAILRQWRPSLAAGFLGAFASQMWFVAFAIENPARVRTLGLVEVLFAGIISRRYFREPPAGRELAGIVVMLAGVAALVAG